MADFSELPSHNVQQHIGNYPVMSPGRVIPWAQIAAQLGQSAVDLSKDLSPAERQRKELEMSILGSKLVSEKQDQEIKGLQIQQYQQNLKDQQDHKAKVNGMFDNDPEKDDNSDQPTAPLTPTPTTFAPVQPNRAVGTQYDPDSPQFTLQNTNPALASSGQFAALPDMTQTDTTSLP